MKNQEIAEIFFQIADLLEMKDVQWKPRAYRTAARSIENLQEPIQERYKSGGLKALKEIPGVGEAIAKKIEELIKTGKSRSLENLKKRVPVNVDDLGQIQGLGSKKMIKLYKELGVKNLKDLKKAAEQHRIRGLDGFGEKSEVEILKSISASKEKRIALEQVLPIANQVKTALQKRCKTALRTELAGSLRRKKPTVHDVDILVATNQPESVMDFFTSIKGVEQVLMKGSTKSSISFKGIQVDLRAVKPVQWGSALLYFTGSKQHNISLRRLAQKKGWKVSEYGLFEKEKVLVSKTEKEIYNKLGMAYIPPTQRENIGEIEKAIKKFKVGKA
ncbi:MAG: hypothetical protein CL943_00125 [Candidatus Diapherotrites archaeon]|uniref:DNA polymerase beta n=1 Tax=Candidatus Iainarchaeum sp. TaxID=3101447 RepID=A0A2D6LZU7_9ARCH|nr:hypothetical protein [Candidatus Diapherotrites archaeon]|tara:strand:+ start:4745 stop:5737 length:993 start_codon:yes stop_codon:yes gene_type:complete